MRRLFERRTICIPLILCFAVSLSGCATMRHPVPKDLVTKAQIGDMDEVRAIIGEVGTPMQENLLESLKQESAEDFPAGPDGIRVYPVLAISGGGANGAYGAGLLKGWSKEGSRPLFKIITGVSTGAISAPYVFLGKEYDEKLEKIYTDLSTKDIMRSKGPLGALFGDSLASNKPLAKTLACMEGAELLEKIAVEHRRGRRLFVGTANLDAQKLVVWDMGAIACRGDVELFHKVILASAAIPVMFPPSTFQVQADGKSYDELHADGGTLTQVFTTYKLLQGMQGAAKKMGIDPTKLKAKLYIIRNGYMSSRYKATKDDLASLAARCFDTIIDTQGIGDTYRIYTFMKQRGNDYNLAYIPPDFVDESKEMFDPIAMKKLFDRGYQDAINGYKWHKAPPGIEAGGDEAGE
jgi:hypothetical protein